MTEQLPAGLEYQDAHWEAALGMIEAHEAKMAWYKVAASILTAACVIGAVVFWTVDFESSANSLAQADLGSGATYDLGQINVDVRPAKQKDIAEPFSASQTPENLVSQNQTNSNDSRSENGVEGIDNTHPEISADLNGQADVAENQNETTPQSTIDLDNVIVEQEQDSEDAQALEVEVNQDNAETVVPAASELTEEAKSATIKLVEDLAEYSVAIQPENTESIQDNNEHPEDLNNTSLSGKGITPSQEESNSSNPVPPEHLDITTTVFEVSSAQLEDVNPTAQPKVDHVDLWHGQWLGAIDKIEIEPIANELDKQPIDIQNDVATYKLWTPRKRFNLQAVVGANIWTDYMSSEWDLFSYEVDQDYSNHSSLQLTTGQELARVEQSQSRWESSIIAGLESDFDINKTWSLRAGLHYSSVNNLRFVETTARELWLGEYESDDAGNEVAGALESAVFTTKLQYASLPVHVSYRIRNKLQLSAGLGIEYLIQGRNLITETTTSGNTVTGELFETQGYVTGFNYLNKFASVGANFYLTESITAGASFQYGLNDITRGGDFALTTYDRPSRAYAYLRFRIF